MKSIVHKLHPLVVIPSVCAAWRCLALGFGSLWSHIDVDEGYTKLDRSTFHLDRMKLWLERASGAPINFHFRNDRSGDEDADADGDVDSKLYDILLPHISRAISFTFSNLRQVHAQNLLNLCRVSCTRQLRALSIRSTIRTPSLARDPFIWPTETLRDLTVLELDNIQALSCPSWHELSSVLSNSPGLHTLRIINAYAYLRQDHGPPEVRLPNLKYVELDPICRISINYQLLKALVPGNCTLHVRVRIPSSQYDENSLSALVAFLRRSNVVYLYLLEPSGGDRSPKNNGVLDSVPRLRFLSVDYVRNTHRDSLTRLASLGSKLQATCASLRVLHIERADMTEPVWDKLRKVIETHQLEKIILGPQASFLRPVTEPAQGTSTRLDWLRERVGQIACNEHVEFPINEDLS